jgi:MFS family permease
MFVDSAASFYALRFVLGVAEAGIFPGIILYLTYWFPAARRARVVAVFMTAIALSGVVGGPLSGWIMQAFAGAHGMPGWQWQYVLEGIPSVLVGGIVYARLDDRVADAKWLSAAEKAVIAAELEHEADNTAVHGMRAAFSSGRVWLMSAIYFCLIMGLYGVSFWLPQLIKSAGVKDVLDVGLLTAVPYGFATVAMILGSKSSDRTGERRLHVAVAAFAGAIGLLLCGLFGGAIVPAMAAPALATMGILTSLPLFCTLPTAFLRGMGAAGGIGIINSVGNLAGFASPFAVGFIKDASGSATGGLLLLAGALALGGFLVLAGTQASEMRRGLAGSARPFGVN